MAPEVPLRVKKESVCWDTLLGRHILNRWSKLLIVKTVAHAEEFLRLSQHSLLNTLKLEYAAIIQTLAETARNKRWDAIKHLDSQLQPKLRAGIVGVWTPVLCQVKGMH